MGAEETAASGGRELEEVGGKPGGSSFPEAPGAGAGGGGAFQDRRNVSVSKVKNARTRCALDLAPNSVLLVGE